MSILEWAIAIHTALGVAFVWAFLPHLRRDDPEKFDREWLSAYFAVIFVALFWAPLVIFTPGDRKR